MCESATWLMDSNDSKASVFEMELKLFCDCAAILVEKKNKQSL